MSRSTSLFAIALLTVAILANWMPGFGDDKKADTLLRHVVLFQFKPDVSQAQIDEVVKAFGDMKQKIDVIVDFEWGTDVSVENRAAGFTHCFQVTFRDEKGRDIYLPHPVHEEFKKLVGGKLANVLVFDYVVKK